ncbi:MAG: alpha-amylase [Ignavibacteriales bacterium]|nr:MAG: alpha-amylase [Ignavibacteriales bacterium]
MKILFLSLIFFQAGLMSQQNDFVPGWAKKAVWYQIFPERFRNGDTSNDPKVENIRGSYPHDAESPWQIHPWGSDWYQLQPYEKLNGNNIWFNIQRRRYGGDLQGILDKLPYLKELGITALYLNPVFEAPSHHKYDGATYHHVDPNFGPDPEGDRKLIENEDWNDPKTWVWTKADLLMLQLIKEVHKNGMKIIFDGVFNHMGINSLAFRDVVKNQKNSKYADWFKILSWDDPEAGTKFSYSGWWGVKELPELNQDENCITASPKSYIFNITRRWMDPDGDGSTADGIDGWRLDVAFCVKHQFWKDWRVHVKSINPEAYLTAEVIDTIPEVQPYLTGDEFDAVMNYNFAFTSAEFFIQKKNKLTASQFDKTLKGLRSAFPECVSYVQQNLFGSHDANRIGSHIVNADLGSYRNWGEYFGLSKGENKNYNPRKPNEEEYAIQKLFALFQMTYVGAPMLYYGDEAGMWGANDPDCRKPMVWDDIPYDDERFMPDQTLRSPDKVTVNKDLLEHYKKLIAIRNTHPELQTGSIETLVTDDVQDVYGFRRTQNNNVTDVYLNNSNKPAVLTLKGTYRNLLSGQEFTGEITLHPKQGVILKKMK